MRLRPLVLACALAATLPAGVRAQDLLTVWRAAAGHDRQLAVATYMGGGPSLMYAASAVAAFDEFSQPR